MGGPHLQEMGSFSRDGVALENLVEGAGMVNELPVVFRGINGHEDKCRDVSAKFLGVEVGMIAADDLTVFQLLQPFADRGNRETNGVRKVTQADS